MFLNGEREPEERSLTLGELNGGRGDSTCACEGVTVLLMTGVLKHGMELKSVDTVELLCLCPFILVLLLLVFSIEEALGVMNVGCLFL
jgi:hypothetical protein